MPPQHRLMGLEIEARLNHFIFSVLLRTESRLRGLQIWLSDQDYCGMSTTNHVAGSIKELEQLALTIHEDQYRDRGCSNWFQHAHNLRAVMLQAWMLLFGHGNGWDVPAPVPRLRLEHLRLQELYCSTSAAQPWSRLTYHAYAA